MGSSHHMDSTETKPQRVCARACVRLYAVCLLKRGGGGAGGVDGARVRMNQA